MDLSFLGATDTVTGSRFLLTTGAARVLVDCGMFQGIKRLRLRNRAPFGVDPASVDAVVLTHAHLDHSGYLPAFVRDGFRGHVWCSPLTARLLEILLRDAAHLAEEEARHHDRHGTSRHRPALPLYTTADAERALARVRTVPFTEGREVAPGLTATLHRSGHILGASTVHIAGDGASVAFTGDVGRPDDPVMLPPEPLPRADVVVTESTYGDRVHDATDPSELLADVVTRTVERGGQLLVPAFAVGRSQAVLHLLAQLRAQGRIPQVPIHLNSPMSIDVTEILLDARGEHRLDADACSALATGVQYHRSVEDSKQLTQTSGPRVVVTASGMLTGGRVLHHLVQLAPDPANTILLVGFQAAGTRGRTLHDRAPTVRVFGQDVPVRAQVVSMHGLSAHADGDQLVQWLSRTPAPTHAYVVHGEPHAADALRRRLGNELGWRVRVPSLGERYDVR